ncbi:hypothetical protein J3E74DRAFT_295813 [Bipolaris maydis]|nr:hypothetical protein J3E74DRAFT_296961 [Bipolaris maydis]KAJ5051413.1 hypothetical protein J3E74DRAFT_295813 [Bipolaris maydis]
MAPFYEDKDRLALLKIDKNNGNAQCGVIPRIKRHSELSKLCLKVETEEHKDLRDASKNSDSIMSNDLVGGECHQTTNTLLPFEKESALIGYLITKYASLTDSAFNSSLIDTRYERPRAAPAPPKRDLIDSVEQRGSISVEASTKSEPVSKNFRRLRLDIQHSNRLIHSAHTYSGFSTPKHILDAIRSPAKIFLPGRKRVQSLGPGEKQTTYSPSFSRHSWTHPTTNRYSEGTLQRVPINLNKSLPTLPLQARGQNDE